MFAWILAASLASVNWWGDGRAAPGDAKWYGERAAVEFRTRFVLPKGVTEATIEVAALGYYELFDAEGALTSGPMPLWSPFNKTIYADSYQLRALKAAPATNEVRLVLGNGFWNLPPLRFWGSKEFRRELAHGAPCFKAVISGVDELKWEWRTTPIVRNSVYLGTEIDNRRGYGAWQSAVCAEGAPGHIVNRRAPAVVTIGSLAGKARWLDEGKKIQVVDFGVNATGRPVFPLIANPTTTVEIVYGELLNADGSVNPLTQTAGQIKHKGRGGPGAPALAAQRDTFVGSGIARFPFTWHIFRYAEIRGADKLVEGAKNELISSDLKDMPMASSFNSADGYLNRLHEVCRRTFRNNLIGVQSDCPGRERLGYGGDIVATAEAMALNFDMREFYLKTLQDFADEAAEDGWITETAPYVGIADRGYGGRSGPISWALAVPVMMDTLIRNYPDVRERALAYYPVCARYVRLLSKKFPDLVIPRCIGDHETLDRVPNDVLATAHYYEFVRLTASFAKMLGYASEVAEFNTLAVKIAETFRQKYVVNGVVANGSQAAQALGLYLKLVPTADVDKAFAALKAALERNDYGITTGIFCTRYLLLYLAESGHNDLARKVVFHEGFPGWKHMLDSGATTLWEHWEYSDNVYSNCHPMFGSVDEWILKYSAIGF